MQQNKDHYRTQHPYHVWDSLQMIPDLLQDCLEGDVQADIQKIVADFQKRGINKLIMLGRGSSYFAALSVESLFEKLTRLPVSCYVTNIFQEYPYERCDSKTAVFFISHSGKSEGDLRVVEQVKKMGAYTIGVTDIPGSALAEAVDQLLIGPGGSKIELPASRTYATAIYRLQLLAQSLAEALKVVDDPDEYKAALLALPEQVKTFMTSFETEAPKVVDLLSDRRYQLIVGYGPNWANAGEAAMAFNQSSGIPTLRYEMENYIHGPIQGLTPDAGVIGIAPFGCAAKSDVWDDGSRPDDRRQDGSTGPQGHPGPGCRLSGRTARWHPGPDFRDPLYGAAVANRLSFRSVGQWYASRPSVHGSV